MADTTPAQPIFNIQRIYLKDASLEIPNAPQIFLESDSPTVEVQLDIGNKQVLEGIHEVTVMITVTTRIKDQVAFLIELKQAGIFEVRDVPAEQMEPLLGILCPSIVYPYVRANLADMINRTGFAPMHLAEINFEVLFNQRKAALAEQAQKSALVGATGTPIQ
jgi:preprotein translocase subunit SecB